MPASKSPGNKAEIRIEVIRALQAVAVAVIALFSGVVGHSIKGPTEKPTEAAAITPLTPSKMPLEGLWNYKMEYSRFQNSESAKNKQWVAEGNAVIVWEHDKYIILVAAKVRDVFARTRDPTAMYAFRGSILANKEGMPIDPKVSFVYVATMANSP